MLTLWMAPYNYELSANFRRLRGYQDGKTRKSIA
jgi:hypothetical protein